MRFTAEVLLGGKTATGIPVPPEVVEGLGGGKKPAVTVTINGYVYRSSFGSRGGQVLIPLSAEHRAGAGVEAGQQIEVDVELDTAPREVLVPEDLAEAMAETPGARAYFDSLSYSNKQGVVQPIESAKAADTRARRIARSVELLAQGKFR